MLSILQLSLYRLFSFTHFWIILAAGQFILAWSFLVRVETWLNKQNELDIKDSLFGVTDFVLIPLFQLALSTLIFIVPFLCAQSIAGEKQQQTWALLSSSPIASYKLILGKFLSIMVIPCSFILMILLMAFSLSWGTQLDYGQLWASSFLFLLNCATLTMLGIFISSCSNNIISATLITLASFLLLFNTQWFTIDEHSVFLQWLSFREHMNNAYQGLLSSYDILFFIAFTLLVFILAVIKLEKK